MADQGGDERGKRPRRAYGVRERDVAGNKSLPSGSNREAPSQEVLASVAPAPTEGAGAVRARGPLLRLAEGTQGGLCSGPLGSEASACGGV